MLITFEGIDFSGKSTQIQKLKLWIKEENKTCFLVREPGGNPISEAIRELLLDARNHDMISKTELLLYSASRAQLTEKYIKPALKKNDFVICDRFYDSTTAYQGAGRNLDLNFIQALNKFSTSHLIPDLTFLIDITAEESYKRRQFIKNKDDRIERAGKDFFETIRSAYLNMAKDEKRIHCIDGCKDENEISGEIIKTIKDYKRNIGKNS